MGSARKKALFNYTREVMIALKAQGTSPDLVQVGNEINHGIVWPEGNLRSFDSLGQRYKRDLIVVEYSELKNEVNQIAFELPDGRGKGTCMWTIEYMGADI
ncbi:MAG: glycosyl hydrolase 53 family protein [Gemmatimonadaceae bacterium]|nr:glycosyl hydrolase 53 family protein [Chitinophagaceae bacterium]